MSTAISIARPALVNIAWILSGSLVASTAVNVWLQMRSPNSASAGSPRQDCQAARACAFAVAMAVAALRGAIRPPL
jgi:hypothetical protein